MQVPATGREASATRRQEEGERMQELEKLRNWLQTFPGWDSEVCFADFTEGTPGNSGLFPQGMEEVSRREDVLGNLYLRCRYRFRLLRVADKSEDKNAQWLMDFANWVQAQSAAGLAPHFGDEPDKETMRAEKGKLSQVRQTGASTYEVLLTAEFTKYYEVIE